MYRSFCQTTNFVLVAAMVTILAQVSRAQTYEASSFQSEKLHPRAAFDGDMNSRWSADFKSKTGWIQVTYAKKRTFKSVTIRSGIRDLKGAPKDFDILAGEPGKLRVLKSITGNSKDDQTFKFSSKSARCWRIAIKSRISPRWSPTISEIILGDRGKPSTLADKEEAGVGDDPKYSAWTRSRGRNGIAFAFDDDVKSRFEADKKGANGWIEVNFKNDMTFDALLMRHTSESGRGVPQDFTVQFKKGRRWKSVGKGRGNFTNQPRLRFPQITAKDWRIKVDKLVDDRSYWSPSEIKFMKLGDVDFLPEPEAKVKQERINSAIDDGVGWLKKKQKPDGNFPSKSTREFPMGVMALGALALRKSGLNRDDPVIQDFVTRISKFELKKTYSVALYAMFLSSVSTKRYQDKLQNLADWIVQEQGPEGLWGYPTGRVDLSNAQYALLGLKACAAGGAKVDKKVWQKAWDWFLKHPEKNGGFHYVPTKKVKIDPITGSMTAAALACLKICANQLPKDKNRLRRSEKVSKAALNWLGMNFVAEMNPGSGRSHYYYLYGVERVGSYYRLRRLGTKPWYMSGAKLLVEKQFSNGSWHNNFEDTCFALLFLRRASSTGG